MNTRAERNQTDEDDAPTQPTHGLAIARYEENNEGWLKGGFFALTRGDKDLQELVGKGGTLWIVVSRRGYTRQTRDGERVPTGRLYSLEFRLEQCGKKQFPRAVGPDGKQRPYGVKGDPHLSRHFASNDARLLLMSLRFDPTKPIGHAGVIGQSIQTPRTLAPHDVTLLEQYVREVDRWSVVISYDRKDLDKAMGLANGLTRRGVSTFIDREGLVPGRPWRDDLEEAINRARTVLLLVGRRTHTRREVLREIAVALDAKVPVIPVLLDGNLERWNQVVPALPQTQAVTYGDPNWPRFIDGLISRLPRH